MQHPLDTVRKIYA